MSKFLLVICVLFAPLLSAQEDENKACQLFSRKYFRGTPVLSLTNTVKVFDTSLIFESKSDKGINIQSVKLSQLNCSVILCNEKHLKGECTRVGISQSGKSYKNIRSVDCHCDDRSRSMEDGAAEESKETTTMSEKGHSSQQLQEEVDNKQECATIYRDWHYQGHSQALIFPGSTNMVDMGRTQRVRSIKVRNGCSVVLWGSCDSLEKQDTFSTSTSASFLQLNHSESFNWACCSCDHLSQSVCQTAQISSALIRKNFIPEDHSQFTKFGKKIIGIGRNYRWRKSELAQVLQVPTEPLVFLKPTTSYITEGQPIELPSSLGTIFYELELGVVIGKKGKDIPESQALDHVAGYFLALDMTAKQFIKRSGNQSLPWEIGKGFDTACPVGDFVPKSHLPNPNNVHLECTLNGNVTQSESTSQMIFSVEQLISYVSRYMTLEPYDVVITGTPDGFGPLQPGDLVEGRLGNITSISFTAVLSSS